MKRDYKVGDELILGVYIGVVITIVLIILAIILEVIRVKCFKKPKEDNYCDCFNE